MTEPVWIGPTTLAEAVQQSEKGLRVSDTVETNAYLQEMQNRLDGWMAE